MASIEILSGMRERALGERRFFPAPLRPGAGFFIILLLLLTGIFFFSAARERGVRVMARPRRRIGPHLEHVRILISLSGPACATSRGAACGRKAAGIPVWYGFDEKGVYFHDEFGSVMYPWECFNAPWETQDFFPLRDGARAIPRPKDIWDEVESLARHDLMVRKSALKDTRIQ